MQVKRDGGNRALEEPEQKWKCRPSKDENGDGVVVSNRVLIEP